MITSADPDHHVKSYGKGHSHHSSYHHKPKIGGKGFSNFNLKPIKKHPSHGGYGHGK